MFYILDLLHAVPCINLYDQKLQNKKELYAKPKCRKFFLPGLVSLISSLSKKQFKLNGSGIKREIRTMEKGMDHEAQF